MKGNIGALIIGIGFLCLALFDMTGVKIHIHKKFRERVGVREWQKKRAIADIIVCVGAGIIYFDSMGRKEIFIAGCCILTVGFILLLIFDSSFREL